MSTLPVDVPPLLAPQPGPATLKGVRWGGTRLAALRGAPAGVSLPIGESWEFSTLPGAGSRALGRDLVDVLGGPLPFLAKLIDTAAPLSIQVHPHDDPARGTLGKEEAWIILDAADGAAVLAGAADGIDDRSLRDAMQVAIDDPSRDSRLIEALRRIEVSPGMVIVVPAGTVHAIGPGVLLAEIQQPVDCTYRLFDYGSGRPIHPEDAAAAWHIDAQPKVWRPGQPRTDLHGRHVSLDVRLPGVSTLDATQVPHLLVAVGGSVRVHAHEPSTTITIGHGDLLLHVRGAADIEVSDGGQLVVGRAVERPTLGSIAAKP